MGRLMHDLRLAPDYLVSSTAKRARKTSHSIIEETRFRSETRFTNDLYHAPAEKIFQLVKSFPDAYTRVLIVGHNPGLEEFLEQVTGEYTPLTTAALARIEIAVDHWQDVAVGAGKLVGLWQPRELA